MTTKEEVHWSSFRSAVVGLQHSLRAAHASSALADIEGISHARDEVHHHDMHHHRNGNNNSSSALIQNDDLGENTQSALDNDASKERTKPQSNEQDKSNALDHFFEASSTWDGRNIETNNNEAHHRLELIGLEEVNTGDIYISSRNNVDNDLISPSSEPSHTSQTASIALSIAEQQLANMRLKLAMTESERDELEFQLMQK